MLRKVLFSFVLFAPALVTARLCAEPPVRLNQGDYCDRVYACWLGKSLGGTLGQPLEGQQGPHAVPMDTPLSRGIANDELDLELLWLQAVEENAAGENSTPLDARKLGPYWLKYVVISPGEYGIGMQNMRRGLLPPLSGHYENPTLKHSNGGWARAEIWACLAPGCPALAAQMAREDACVDHGVGEGTLAEMFVSALESAAFVEHDTQKLLAIALAMIPEESELSRAVRGVIADWKAGKDWKTARQNVIDMTKTGWFMAPRDVAFIVLGWLYGEGDYRRTLITTLNCGDDSDSTVATVGSILGIAGGTAAIDPTWKQSVGSQIKTCILSQEFHAPRDLDELTQRTLAQARKILQRHGASVTIVDGPADLSRADAASLGNVDSVRQLWSLSPYRIVWREPDCDVTVDYQGEPVIVAGVDRTLRVTVRNLADRDRSFRVRLQDLPSCFQARQAEGEAIEIPAGKSADWSCTVDAKSPESDSDYRFAAQVLGAGEEISIPLALFTGAGSVAADDLALASRGAVATSDSELAWESHCTPEVNDGILASVADFSNRWHSSLETPHPHWVQIRLAKPATIDRIVIRFADPAARPLDFHGQVIPAGKTEYQEVFRVQDNQDRRRCSRKIAPVLTDTFRLTIDKSINPVSLNAAQVSEIEIYGAP